MSYYGLVYPKDEGYLREVKERGYFILVDRNAKNISLIPGGQINNILATNNTLLFVFGRNIAGTRQDIIDSLYLLGLDLQNINNITSFGISIDNINTFESQQWITIFHQQNVTPAVTQLTLAPKPVTQLTLAPIRQPVTQLTLTPIRQPVTQLTLAPIRQPVEQLTLAPIRQPVVGVTTVVCVKVNDIRPKYNNLEEWMNDPNNVYIARRGVVFVEKNGEKYRFPKEDSIWANPFKITGTMTREIVINMYRNYIVDKLIRREICREQLLQLKGKTLGCWCKEGGQNIPCHGDVLIELLYYY
jgi:hypothetical protein